MCILIFAVMSTSVGKTLLKLKSNRKNLRHKIAVIIFIASFCAFLIKFCHLKKLAEHYWKIQGAKSVKKHPIKV